MCSCQDGCGGARGSGQAAGAGQSGGAEVGAGARPGPCQVGRGQLPPLLGPTPGRENKSCPWGGGEEGAVNKVAFGWAGNTGSFSIVRDQWPRLLPAPRPQPGKCWVSPAAAPACGRPRTGLSTADQRGVGVGCDPAGWSAGRWLPTPRGVLLGSCCASPGVSRCRPRWAGLSVEGGCPGLQIPRHPFQCCDPLAPSPFLGVATGCPWPSPGGLARLPCGPVLGPQSRGRWVGKGRGWASQDRREQASRGGGSLGGGGGLTLAGWTPGYVGAWV